jgi:hypothetical protein
MAKFREVYSGQVYEYNVPYDIDQMRKHPDYAEVIEASPEVKTKELKEPTKE